MAFEAVLLISIILGFTVLLIVIRAWINDVLKSQKPSDELLEIVRMLEKGSQQDRKLLLDSLAKNTASLNYRLDKAAEVIGQVQKNIGEFSEIGRGMKEIQQLLQSPKLRGTLGEHILKELLSQILPKTSYNLQYAFKTGHIVDAVIITKNNIIPIDAKFPLSSFRKLLKAKSIAEKAQHKRTFASDVKKHIRDISAKYILAEEGTVDFALMYIPTESVYYEIANTPSLFDYATQYRVLPVSPTTFYAYLRAILMSFEGQRIEEQAQQILVLLRAIQKDYSKLESSLRTLGKHITNAYNTMNMIVATVTRMGQKIASVKDIKQKEIKKLKD